MSVASKYNKMNVFDFKVPDTFKYRSLHDLFKENGAKHVYTVRALYINRKSQYGDAPVVATDDCLVNLPNHITETVETMLTDEELVKAVNAGLFGFTIYSYSTQKAKGTFYSVTWVDIEK